MTDLFGHTEEDPPESPPTVRRPTSARGHAAPKGTGPSGETCGSCEHLARVTLAKVYLKCGRMRPHWTNGRGTDVLARDAACREWTP